MASAKEFLFTSEAVGEGHPDKLCDQVSDAILDACLKQDPLSRCAVETAAKDDIIAILGEVSTKAKVNYEEVVRQTVRRIGYDSELKGLDAQYLKFLNFLSRQSPNIANAVCKGDTDVTELIDFGAGDQGIMFGYATDETPECMPMSHLLATKLLIKLSEIRRDPANPASNMIYPDCKAQVTVRYREDAQGHLEPVNVHTVVISTQHARGMELSWLKTFLHEQVIRPVIPEALLTADTKYFLNSSGIFEIGGPVGDAGLTGRKIIVDTYGGWGAHGGGAFSGKDATKVDRSACYAARWVAKSLVAAGLCRRVLIQLSYAIGVSDPLSIHVEDYGTANKARGVTNAVLVEVIRKNFDLRPVAIMRDLKLAGGVEFYQTARFGHFGRSGFPWEDSKTLDLAGCGVNE